ncbi:hypothetical protein F5Y18DRAFT_368354 [Xylariaceae sp. FL1019]|nr:hypothetical protein F5Y18DRAFT_368354 [Xylariaceae sp. FL1019]
MLSTLPTELIQEVLEQIGDLKSLSAATRTCRVIHDAFAGAKDIILINTLRRLIHPSMLPEALTRMEIAYQFGPHFVEAQVLDDFTTNFYTTKFAPPKVWTTVDARYLCRFHNMIEHVSAWLLGTYMERAGDLLGKGQPTATEVRRVQKALYRYDIWCHVFADQDGHASNSNTEFFSHYEMWEIEQIVCVHDALFEMAELPYNEMVEHDVGWGASKVPYLRRESRESNYILGRGVEFLYHIFVTNNHWRLRRWLGIRRLGMDQPRATRHGGGFSFIISRCLWIWDSSSINSSYYHEWEEKRRTNSKKRLAIGSDVEDMDTGPAAAWKHVNPTMRTLEGTIGYHPSLGYSPHIQWGYVFWDMNRLERGEFFRREDEDEDTLHDVRHRIEPPSDEALGRSQELRRWIDVQGGLGWWSEEDQSKVIYRESRMRDRVIQLATQLHTSRRQQPQ